MNESVRNDFINAIKDFDSDVNIGGITGDCEYMMYF